MRLRYTIAAIIAAAPLVAVCADVANKATPWEQDERATLSGWVFASDLHAELPWIELRSSPLDGAKRIADIGFSCHKVHWAMRKFHGHRVLVSAIVVRHGRYSTIHYVTDADHIRPIEESEQPRDPS